MRSVAVSRWRVRDLMPWILFSVLVLLPLYGLAFILAARSGLFDLRRKALTSSELSATWGFVGSAIAGAVVVVGFLFTRAQAKRTERRLALDTAVSGLQLVSSNDGHTYAPKAVVAGALATLVHLDYPVIAMRTLAAAWEENAVDAASATWLINEVYGSENEEAQLEAAVLLDRHATELCLQDQGSFLWPSEIEYIWPDNISLRARILTFRAILKVLMSKTPEWWEGGGRAGWATALFREVMLTDPDNRIKREAIVALKILLPKLKISDLLLHVEWKPVEDVKQEVAKWDAELPYTNQRLMMLIRYQNQLITWVT